MTNTGTEIRISWNAQTVMYQADVVYRGRSARFALPDAVNDWDARRQAERVMSRYRRETGGCR